VLEVSGLRAGYGAAEVVRGVSLSVEPGQVVAVVGRNGAGKSTLASALAGLHRATAGTVRLAGRDLTGHGPVRVARAGLALVPQGRRVFASLTVDEHLRMAARLPRDHAAGPTAWSVEDLLDRFPPLASRRRVRARELSGGEQQMLAISRAVLLGPRVLVLDEPTEGLAPGVVSLVTSLLTALTAREVGVLLMEQPGRFPDQVADRVLTIDRGVLSTPAPQGGRP